MKVETLSQGNSLILLTEGRVDGTNAVDFQSQLENAIKGNDHPVVLDFENLSYISSAGLSGDSGCRQSVAEAERQVRRVLSDRPGQGSIRD